LRAPRDRPPMPEHQSRDSLRELEQRMLQERESAEAGPVIAAGKLGLPRLDGGECSAATASRACAVPFAARSPVRALPKRARVAQPCRRGRPVRPARMSGWGRR
jgi:hypothetical protein